MKVSDLVKHESIDSLGIGLVTALKGVHCMVIWPGATTWTTLGEPTLEANKTLEVISESR